MPSREHEKGLAMSRFQPMLAAKVDPSKYPQLVFPLIVSPKIDGVRCTTVEIGDGQNQCTPLTRNLNPIRNRHIYRLIGMNCPPGLDGELIKGYDLPGPEFYETNSSICRGDGEPEFSFHIFDYVPCWVDSRWHNGIMTRYEDRLKQLKDLQLPKFCKIVEHTLVNTQEEFFHWYGIYLDLGFEGLCARAPHSPYKFGRSTFKEHWLLKLKATEDEIGVVVGTEELMHNANELVPDSLVKRRTLHQEGMVPMNRLGALIVKWNEQEFRVGTGFGAADRDNLWAIREKLVGRKVKFQYQKFGTKDKPRCPAFICFMDAADHLSDHQQQGNLI